MSRAVEFTVTSPIQTPCVTLSLRRFDGRETTVTLKLEGYQISGSMKYRTAVSMVDGMHRQSPLLASDVLIESSSGNVALALATIARDLGINFRAVVDPYTPESTIEALRLAGAGLTVASIPDAHGGYLECRLRTVQELASRDSRYRWTNQYENEANPLAHATATSAEIVAQLKEPVEYVYAPVSTGGLVAGLSKGLHARWPDMRMIAVDAVGSAATGGPVDERLIPGLGSSRRSAFWGPESATAVRIDALEAIAACRWLGKHTGLWIGGSAGASLACVLAALSEDRAWAPSLIVCPDGGSRYASTIYSDDWLRRKDFLTGVNALAGGWSLEFQVALADNARVEH